MDEGVKISKSNIYSNVQEMTDLQVMNFRKNIHLFKYQKRPNRMIKKSYGILQVARLSLIFLL